MTSRQVSNNAAIDKSEGNEMETTTSSYREAMGGGVVDLEAEIRALRVVRR
jgi:hypothetical protein